MSQLELSRPRSFSVGKTVKHPVVRFVGLLGILVVVIEVLLNTQFVLDRFVGPELDFFARVLAAVLRLLGEDATADGQFVYARFSVEIVQGCDALRPVLLFLCAVLASPVAWRTKIPGAIAGTLILTVANIVRLVILYYIGKHFSRKVFDFMHSNVSQMGFILLIILLWVGWALWAVKRTRGAVDVAA